MEKDPVCGMEMDTRRSQLKISENGVDRYFCSESCRDKYIARDKGWFTRLIEWIAHGNRERYGSSRPSCCDR